MKNNGSKIWISIFIVLILLPVGCWNIVMRLRMTPLMKDIIFRYMIIRILKQLYTNMMFKLKQ